MVRRKLKRIERHDLSKITFTRAMNGEEIAKSLGVTRQNVSNLLKRAMKKVYYEVSKLDESWSPFQIATVITQMFNVTNQEDITKMFNLFPPDIKQCIESDAKRFIRCETEL